MTEEDAIDAIKRRWITLWPTASATVAGESVPYALTNVAAVAKPYYARLKVVGAGSDQTSFGGARNRRFERRGIIDVRISGPTGVGEKMVLALGAKVRELFEGVRFGFKTREMGVVTHAASAENLTGDSQAKDAFVRRILIPFECTHVK